MGSIRHMLDAYNEYTVPWGLAIASTPQSSRFKQCLYTRRLALVMISSSLCTATQLNDAFPTVPSRCNQCYQSHLEKYVKLSNSSISLGFSNNYVHKSRPRIVLLLSLPSVTASQQRWYKNDFSLSFNVNFGINEFLLNVSLLQTVVCPSKKRHPKHAQFIMQQLLNKFNCILDCLKFTPVENDFFIRVTSASC
jgi:hypothetical protein